MSLPFCSGFNGLMSLVLNLEHSLRTRSIACQLMPWLLALPGHQQPWYQLPVSKIVKSLPSTTTRNNFNHCAIAASRNDKNCNYTFMLPQTNPPIKELTYQFIMPLNTCIYYTVTIINYSNVFLTKRSSAIHINCEFHIFVVSTGSSSTEVVIHDKSSSSNRSSKSEEKSKKLDPSDFGFAIPGPVFYLWLSDVLCLSTVNPLRAKFFRGNINIYLHFVSFLHIDTTQVVEILPQIR